MDHSERENRKENPRDRANIFSLITFSYLGGLWKKAYKHQLHDENLYDVLKQCRSQHCGDKLEKQWNYEQKTQQKPCLLRVVWTCWGRKLSLLVTLDFFWNTFSSIVKPYILSRLVAYFAPGQSHTTRNEAYFFASSMLFLHVAQLTYMHNFTIYIQALGIEIRTSFSSLLYRKSLKLTPAALSDISIGHIVTLITKDVQSFNVMITMINDSWIAITQVVVICYLLFMKVGSVSFVGIGILLSAIPLQAYLGYWITKLRLEAGQLTDERLQLTQEILSTMKIIKMYTWEAFFTKNITEARRKEATKLLTGMYLKRVLLYVGILFCNLGFYMLLLTCGWTGIATDITIIFYIISNFKDLRQWMAIVLPYAIGTASELISSYKRIVHALTADELNFHSIVDEIDKPLLELKDVSVHIKEKEVLKHISFKVSSGLNIITGTVGSGKSSIFKTILRDYPVSSGSVTTKGTISYASQDPWLFPSSIKQNILFGAPYNEKRYREVIRVCALSYDFNLLENGDETILIDRGSNFSKGQQSRINLARAVYRKSDIYILDDCLTALDATVQNYIFKECIKTFLKDKICILVSQSARQMKEADTVIVIDEGCITNSGKPSKQILDNIKVLAAEENDTEKESIDLTINQNGLEADEKSKLLETGNIVNKVKVYKEDKNEGLVDFRVYKKYIVYGGGIFVMILNLVFRGVTTFSVNNTDKLLTNWIDRKQTVLLIENNISQAVNTTYYNSSLEEAIFLEDRTFKFYTIFLFISSAAEMFTSYMLVQFCKNASINMHAAMVKNMLKAVMTFFDTHFIGNILNRFSQDLFNIDEYLSYALDQCIRTVFSIGGVLTLLILVNQQFAIIAFLILTILLILRSFYQPAGRCLKRLEASTRSPMIGHLNATLEGLTTIRACKVQHILINEFDKHQDLYTSAHYLSQCSNRAFGFFVDIICSTFVAFIIVKFLFFYTSTSAGDIGLSLTQVVGLTMGITWAIRQWSDLENNMTSLERILEYTDIQTEKEGGIAVENWPKTGSICYKNVYLSYYNNDNCVLKNLTFYINDKEKIGIVGRTGAGKSSILSSIFRLYNVEGSIQIDGADTKSLSLDFLRKHIAVIPQDPVLFSGTVRTNLDPLNEFEDFHIWKSLERVGLKSYFFSLNETINSTTSNFSSGQKQLICLARAILRRNKIVVLDEATANMDHQTDAVLHTIIMENFADSTILIIAHRLQSVMGCDRIMVLDKGEIVEFDKPKDLIENRSGLFYKMVQQNGL